MSKAASNARIGIIPELAETTGGVYQYSMTMLRGLKEIATDHDVLVFLSAETELSEAAMSPGWRMVPFYEARTLSARAKRLLGSVLPPRAKRTIRKMMRRAPSEERTGPADFDTVQRDPQLAKWFGQFNLDLMIYPNHNQLSFALGIPYVIAIHDLQHRLQPEFPEVSADGEWEAREYGLRNCIRHATLVLVDSQIGKEDVLRFYGEFGAREDRIKVVPYLPATPISGEVSEGDRSRVKARYELPARFLFYPSQFWPHKNHLRIVEALGKLTDQGLDVSLVLTGSHTGKLREETFAQLVTRSKELGIAGRIHHLGYVPEEDIPALYVLSSGLVMPTFFGPTNIPVVEAFALGCPVITSDIRGIREQVGDAALLVDPGSVDSIAGAVRRLLEEPGLAQELVERGRKRISSYTFKDYCRLLAEALDQAQEALRLSATAVREGAELHEA